MALKALSLINSEMKYLRTALWFIQLLDVK